MELVRVTRKGQITIPVECRKKLGIRVGDVVSVELRGKEVVLRRFREPVGNPVGWKEYTKAIQELDELREKWR